MEHHPSSTAPHSIGLSQSFPGMSQAAPAPPPPVLLQGQQPPIQGQQPYHHLLHQQQQQLHSFWAYQMQEIEQVSDFKTHQLPLARIKKIMKADEDVRMISAEAPVLFAKACEMFILELTLRSWIHAEENKRRTLQRNDIAAAITRTDIFDFLVDIVPRDELKEEGLGLARGGLPEVSYFYPPIHQPQQGIMGSPSIMMGRPAMQMDPSLYMQQPRAVSMPYSMPPHQPVQQVWQQQQQHQQQVPDGQPYGHPHQQQMPDGQSYGQHLPDGHSYGAPPPPPPPPAT